MTLECLFRLNLIAENQYVKVKILGERNKSFEINFKYERKKNQLYTTLVSVCDWSISHLETEVNDNVTESTEKSVLVIYLFNKGKKGEKENE